MLSSQHEISGFTWVDWQGRERDIRSLALWQLENLLMYMEECALGYCDRLRENGVSSDWREHLSGAYFIICDEIDRRASEAVA